MRQRRAVGQSTLEVAVLLAVIAAVLIAMAIWYKRAGMGRLRQAADQLGSQFSIQDSTGESKSDYKSTTTETRVASGVVTTDVAEITQDQKSNTKTGVTSGETLY